MKKLATILVLLSIIILPAHAANKNKNNKMISVFNRITRTWASYPSVSIHDINYVSPAVLHECDSLQSNGLAWDSSQYVGDTVIVTGLVVVPSAADTPKIGINYTQDGWAMLLHDTAANSNSWGGLFIRCGSDTNQDAIDGFNNPVQGDIIQMVAVVQTYPTPNSGANTAMTTKQVQPIPGFPITKLSENNLIPAPTPVGLYTFYQGPYPAGKYEISTGEQYQSSLIVLHNVVVSAIVNSTRGQFQVTDSAGNDMRDYDISYYYTLGNAAGYHDPNFKVPPVGAVITTLKGTISTVSGQWNPYGYQLCPLFPGDVVYGVSLPTIDSVRRSPVVVNDLDIDTVYAKVEETSGGYAISSAVPPTVYVSLNGAAYKPFPMTMVTLDSVWAAALQDSDGNPFSDGTNVRYFVKATDIYGNSQILANGSSNASTDSSQGVFFYNVIDRPLAISDLQYTPYLNGISPYRYGKVTVTGVVTAGDSQMTENASTVLATAGTTCWYIQSATGPWNGILVIKDSTVLPPLDTLLLGDSVSVSGTVEMASTGSGPAVTEIVCTAFSMLKRGAQVPAPVTITTGTFGGRPKGDPVARPYLGSLIRVVNAVVTSVYPYYSDNTEYEINDGSGPMRVRRDGINSYSNIPADTSSGKTILYVGEQIDTLIGVGFFSFNSFIIDPRTNADFTVGTPYPYNAGWNLISLADSQTPASTGYSITGLFPGATSSAYGYSGAYIPTTNMYPGPAYWIKFGSATTIRQGGDPGVLDTIPVVHGWNMVGALGTPIQTSSVVALPTGNHLQQFFAYQAHLGYVIETTLNPTQGYWVKSDSTGYIVEMASAKSMPKATSPLDKSNSLEFADANGNQQTLYFAQDDKGKIDLKNYEMPPAYAPTGFDVRYSSGTILETYDSRTTHTFDIVGTSKPGAIALSWKSTESRATRLVLSVIQNGKNGKTIDLHGAGKTSLPSLVSGTKYELTIGGVNIPTEFYLAQNYPNPFNPTTTIEVGLPVASHLTVTIYNVLGQKVATLVDGQRQAGVQSIMWNGTSQTGSLVSSGVYFVHMSAGSFNATKKIMMMK
jgi:hypothetical protein